jgi:hypothetical protein
VNRPEPQPTNHRAREILAAVGHAYPHAWQQVDRVRAARGKAAPEWPEWCFLPLRTAHAIVAGSSRRRLPYERQHHPSIVGALAAWRVTQGIYRFDPAIYEALIETPLTRELPIGPLYCLPEWCIYLECPGLTWPIAGEERPIHGAWAHLDLNDSTGCEVAPELRIVLDTARVPSDPLNTTHGCIAIPLIGRGTIAESLEFVLSFGVKEARAHGVTVAAELTDAENVARILWPIISLLLYVCTESGQIGDGLRRPVNPQPKRTRHGWRQFPADRPTTWDVGVRIGAALRRAYQQQANQDAVPTGRHLRGHVRLFHWHTFLAGPGRTERRVKWLPPIWVNLDNPDSMPATVRRVQ